MLFCIFLAHFLIAQDHVKYIKIAKITLKGYRKTSRETILRELDFKEGDSILISKMQERFMLNQQMLLNSTLFSVAEINIGEWDYEQHQVEIVVKLVERWFIWPFGWVDLADRNFNVWWNEKNRDLRRLNYQLGLDWNNFTGHRDELKMSTAFGFGRKYELQYKIPGFNHRKTVGATVNVYYNKNKEIWYDTRNDSLQFYRNEEAPQIRRFRTTASLTYRPKLRTIHQLQIGYFHNTITNDVAKDRNPDFFLEGRTTQRYFSANYKYTKDRRDNRFYTQHGSFFTTTIEKNGLFSRNHEDVNALYLHLLFAKYTHIYGDIVNYEGIIKVRKELTGNKQPYFNQRALGYQNDYLRGFESYVIDGQNFVYFKNSIRYLLFKKKVDLGTSVPAAAQYLPIKIWLTFNNDFGYVKNPSNSADNVLPNKLLWGRGLGVNLLLYQASYFQFELSQNYFKKVGFYFHIVTPLE